MTIPRGIDDEGVKAKCRNCGREAPASHFVLDSAFKMVVCPTCVKERKTKETAKEEDAPRRQPAEKKPAGWDSEDETLERAAAAKAKNTVAVEHMGDSRVRYRCPKCAYTFVYNTAKRLPNRCPYCSADVARMMMARS